MGRRAYVFAALTLFFASILLPYIYYSIKVYKYIHSDDRISASNEWFAPNDPRSTHWTDLWISFASGLVMHCARFVTLNFGKPLVRAIRILKANESDEMEEKFVLTALDHIFKFVVVTTFSIWGFMICKDKAFYPWYLGGSGDAHLTVKDFPLMELNQDVYIYMLVVCGFPLQNLFLLFVHDRTPDFLEMLLHHIVHTALVFCCLIVNQTAIGACIILVHSISDITLHFSKIVYLLNRMDGILKLSIVPLTIAWPYYRLFCFPQIINEFYKLEFEPEIKALEPKRDFSIIFLSCLVFMHLFWYYLMLSMIYRMAMKGEVKDT